MCLSKHESDLSAIRQSSRPIGWAVRVESRVAVQATARCRRSVVDAAFTWPHRRFEAAARWALRMSRRSPCTV